MNSHIAEIGKILIEVVPTLAGLFFGPYAGLGLHLVAKAIGLEKSSPGAVLEVLKGNPDEWLEKLKNSEANNKGMITFLSHLKMPTKISASVEINF